MTNFSGLIKARNVVATIKGKTLPNEKIVIGGHLDSWDLATGAIDNGIGSFSVLDMARTFKKLNLQPARTIDFVMFMGEEEGLLGSRAYVEDAVKNKTIDQIRYMMNYDMSNDIKGYSTSAEDSRELFTSIGAIAHSIDTSFSNLFRVGAGLHSDHQPFMLQGVPTGGGAGGGLPKNAGPCYHADCDVFRTYPPKANDSPQPYRSRHDNTSPEGLAAYLHSPAGSSPLPNARTCFLHRFSISVLLWFHPHTQHAPEPESTSYSYGTTPRMSGQAYLAPHLAILLKSVQPV